MAGPATRHFVHQRATAIVQVPLVLWLVFSIARHAGDTHAEFMAWVSRPITTALLALFVLIVGYHMSLGMGDIIDDYLHGKGNRSAARGLNVLYAAVTTLGAFFSIIAITLIA